MEFDSFIDRTPAGSIVQNTAVCWRVKAAEALRVTLLLSQAGGGLQRIPMQLVEDRWQATATPATAGVWYYAFELETASSKLTYGTMPGGFGGPGQLYAEADAAPWYQLTVVTRLETVPAWYRDARIYHIFVDRFNNGNPDGHVNHPKPNSFLYGQLSDSPYYIKDTAGEIVRWDFYGGNLAGITAKLDWIHEQGFTAIYLSPIFEARSNHRYDTADYLRIDPMLGTLADFKALVAVLHARGMRLILDGVFNHVGRDSRYFNAYDHYPEIGAAQSHQSPYAEWFTFKQWPEDYESWWGVKDLPAIRKDSQAFQNFIAGGRDSVIGYWTGLGVDGWRLDVVDELAMPFVYQIRRLLDRYPERILIGEVWEDASHKVAYGKPRPYLEGQALQAVMNYPQRQLMIDYVQGELSPAALGQRLLTLQANYPQEVFAYNFTSLSTHDTPRILTVLHDDRQQLALLLALATVLPGNWVQFYGDEAGLTGGSDPANRKYYPWQHQDEKIWAQYRQAAGWRQEPALQGAAGFAPFWSGEVFGVLRWTADQAVIFYGNAGDHAVRFDPEAANLAYLPAAWRQKLTAITLAPHASKLIWLNE